MAYDYTFEIPVPDKASLDRLVSKFESMKREHQIVARRVLGHSVADEDWIVFDDILTAEYERFRELLKLLDEKAG